MEIKKKKDSAQWANRMIRGRTILLMIVLGVIGFSMLGRQLYTLQIEQHSELESLAVRQQTLRTTVDANRGTIYDRNGHTLAISATTENIFVSPALIAEQDQNKALIAHGLAEILDLEAADILERMKRTYSQYEVIKEKVEQETANEVRAFITEQRVQGIYLEPTAKRYYPYSALASHALGFVNKQGGAYGIETVYDEELTGTTGMVVTAKNAKGTSMLFQYEQYFDAQNGNNLVLTLDTTVQYFLEKGLAELESRYGTGKGATGIVMDVDTAGVLAMASLPNYDLNEPGKIYYPRLTEGMEEEELSSSLSDLRLRQWRNQAVNDTYEPGSTFKILTLSMALEEGVITKNDVFQCNGNVIIADEVINCSQRSGHGLQTLTEATGNSCNPAFINIGLRVGNQKFYDYMNAFGLTEKTGIDTTGEARGFVNNEILHSELALACYAFGQNFNVTPIALITAQAACINGGYLRQPYFVERVEDQDGNVLSRHDNTPIRQVVSEETSAQVREILEYVVSTGTGKNGRVTGYRVGGKTGTADKVGGGVIVSFCCFAPADDPEVIMLLTLDEPSYDTGTYVSGGNMAAPIASSIMAEILPYLGVEASYTDEELASADSTVPNVVNMELAAAKKMLSENKFSYRVIGEGDTVTDQTPVGGAIVPNNAEILLYMGVEKSNVPCVVPNVIGDRASTANQKLSNAGLIMSVSGASGNSSTIRVISQSIEPGKEVSAGTVVRVQFSDSSVTD